MQLSSAASADKAGHLPASLAWKNSTSQDGGGISRLVLQIFSSQYCSLRKAGMLSSDVLWGCPSLSLNMIPQHLAVKSHRKKPAKWGGSVLLDTVLKG